MKEQQPQWGVLKKVLGRMKKYWLGILCSLTLAGCYVVMSLTIPILAGKAIDCILAPGQVDFAVMGRILSHVALCAAIAGLSQWLLNVLNNRMTFHITRDLRCDAFRHIQSLPLSTLDSHPRGDLVARVVGDIDTFADGLLLGFSQLFTGVMTILGTLLFMFRIHPGIALVVVCITPLSLVVASFIAKRSYTMFKLQSAAKGDQTGLMEEAVAGIRVIRTFSQEDQTMERFNEANEKLGKYALRATFFSSLTNPCTRFVNSVVYAGVALSGALAALSGGITVGSLTTFLNYAGQYTKPFNEISGVVTELQNALACADRVFSLLETPQEAQDPENIQAPASPAGHLEIRDLSFSYAPEKPLLRHIQVEAKPGQRIALVGPTGCGKTTLISLLMGFYTPDAGQILLDGVDIRQMPREALRRSMGMVLQDTWLKSGTVAENIAMGKPEASRQEIIAAARLSHAHSFIRRLPKGYDTVIKESGDNLSQGQKQLLCIARVMLLRPPMLLLDEATSSIDTMTEIRVQKAFDRLMEGRTTFVVAHRLSTVKEADRILYMEGGEILEQGTHQELLRLNGRYKALYESQFAD